MNQIFLYAFVILGCYLTWKGMTYEKDREVKDE
jgi:hypothetical protein